MALWSIFPHLELAEKDYITCQLRVSWKDGVRFDESVERRIPSTRSKLCKGPEAGKTWGSQVSERKLLWLSFSGCWVKKWAGAWQRKHSSLGQYQGIGERRFKMYLEGKNIIGIASFNRRRNWEIAQEFLTEVLASAACMYPWKQITDKEKSVPISKASPPLWLSCFKVTIICSGQHLAWARMLLFSTALRKKRVRCSTAMVIISPHFWTCLSKLSDFYKGSSTCAWCERVWEGAISNAGGSKAGGTFGTAQGWIMQPLLSMMYTPSCVHVYTGTCPGGMNAACCVMVDSST